MVVYCVSKQLSQLNPPSDRLEISIPSYIYECIYTHTYTPIPTHIYLPSFTASPHRRIPPRRTASLAMSPARAHPPVPISAPHVGDHAPRRTQKKKSSRRPIEVSMAHRPPTQDVSWAVLVRAAVAAYSGLMSEQVGIVGDVGSWNYVRWGRAWRVWG